MRARALTEEQQAALHAVVGARLRDARIAMGLTQEQLARALGRTQHWLSEVESGRTQPQLYVIATVAAASGRSVGWFFGEAPAPSPELGS